MYCFAFPFFYFIFVLNCVLAYGSIPDKGKFFMCFSDFFICSTSEFLTSLILCRYLHNNKALS